MNDVSPICAYEKLVNLKITAAPPFKFLCIDFVAGGANEHKLFRSHSKFWDRPEMLHAVAAREVHYGPRVVRYRG